MDYQYKQLEQELSALSKVFSELGARLSEVAKEVNSPGVMPSEKVLEQISASRASFENARTAVHSHAGAMLVSPLPKVGELVSIAVIGTLLKAAAAAEENKVSIEAEREKALAILGRVLSITHRDDVEFKPLQECHAKAGELRSAIANVLWPHRHPDSEPIVSSKHPTNALLNFVENLDTLDDDKWMALETTISESYGKPLFVAASRGKLIVREVKPDPSAAVVKPAAVAPAKAPAPAAEAPKPALVAEKPIEKKVVPEKAPEKPAPAAHAPAPAAPAVAPSAPTVVASAPPAVVEKKVPAPPAPVAPAAAATMASPERKEIVQEKAVVPEKVVPRQAAPVQATAISVAPVVSSEKKEVVEKAQPAPAATAVASVPAVVAAPVAPVATAGAVPALSAPVAAVPPPTPSASPAPVAPSPVAVASRPPAPVPAAAPVAPIHAAPATLAAAVTLSVPAAPPVAAAGPAAVNNTHSAAPAAVAQHASNSLAALATATEPAVEKRAGATATIDIADKQRKEPRLATTASQTSPKAEPKAAEMSPEEEAQQAAAGDASQRPQRWGFWRGNR